MVTACVEQIALDFIRLGHVLIVKSHKFIEILLVWLIYGLPMALLVLSVSILDSSSS